MSQHSTRFYFLLNLKKASSYLVTRVELSIQPLTFVTIRQTRDFIPVNKPKYSTKERKDFLCESTAGYMVVDTCKRTGLRSSPSFFVPVKIS